MSPLEGLNDEALDTLKPTGEFVTPPSGDTPPGGALTVVVEPPEDNREIDALVASLSNYDVTLQTAEDGLTKLHSMDEVANLVLASESIGQSEADEVLKIMPRLSDDVAPISDYTEVPTRTKLIETKAFVTRTLAEEKRTALECCINFLKTEFAHGEMLLKYLSETRLPAIYSDLEALRLESLEDLVNVGVSMNFLHYTTDNHPTLVDFRTRTITRYSTSENFATIPASHPSDGLMKALDDALRAEDFKLFYEATSPVTYTIDTMMALLRSSRISEDGSTPHSYQSLLCYFAGNSAMRALNCLVDCAVSGSLRPLNPNGSVEQANVGQVVAAILNADLSDEDRLKALTVSMPDIRQAMANILVLHRFCAALTPVLQHTCSLFSCYRQAL